MIIYTLTGFLLLFAFFLKLIDLCFMIKYPNWIWLHGEFLINFEGGFVRRGLLGQILYYYALITGNDPATPISISCIIAFAFVLYFYIKEFKAKGYNWWFIFSIVCMGMTMFIIRRDFMLYALMILSYYIWKRFENYDLKSILITLLCILGLFIHESYIFFGIPIIILLVLSSELKLYLKISIFTFILITFGLLCYFKGDSQIVEKIISSWNNICPEIEIWRAGNTGVPPLGWDTKATFFKHLSNNFKDPSVSNPIICFYPVPVRIFMILIYYYFVTNFFRVFKYRSDFNDKDYLNLSALLLLSLICLLPLFTILSCDYSRIYQYATMGAMIPFLILSPSQISHIFPDWYLRMVNRINQLFEKLVKPNKGLFIFMLLFMAISPMCWDPQSAFLESVIGKPIGMSIFLINRYGLSIF